MLGWIRHLAQKWNDWCGDRDMEIAIRRHLCDQGFYGNSAKLRNVRLVAVQRPGWLQIVRFEVTARVVPADADPEGPDPEPQYCQLYGLVRDDIRRKINEIKVSPDPADRAKWFADWSEGLICLRGAQGLQSSSHQSSS